MKKIIIICLVFYTHLSAAQVIDVNILDLLQLVDVSLDEDEYDDIVHNIEGATVEKSTSVNNVFVTYKQKEFEFGNVHYRTKYTIYNKKGLIVANIFVYFEELKTSSKAISSIQLSLSGAWLNSIKIPEQIFLVDMESEYGNPTVRLNENNARYFYWIDKSKPICISGFNELDGKEFFRQNLVNTVPINESGNNFSKNTGDSLMRLIDQLLHESRAKDASECSSTLHAEIKISNNNIAISYVQFTAINYSSYYRGVTSGLISKGEALSLLIKN